MTLMYGIETLDLKYDQWLIREFANICSNLFASAYSGRHKLALGHVSMTLAWKRFVFKVDMQIGEMNGIVFISFFRLFSGVYVFIK